MMSATRLFLACAVRRCTFAAACLLALVPLIRAANISVLSTATYVGDQFDIEYGLGSPSPSKTVYLYINGSEVDQVTNTSNTYYQFTPPTAGNYTFDVYYSDSVNGPTSPTYNNTAGTYSVSNPPAPSITNGSAIGTVGIAFSCYIDGGTHVSSYDASGLPTGLSVNTSSGQIYGTPTTSGTYSVSVSAYNVSGSDSGTVTITINPQVPASISTQPKDQSPASAGAVVDGPYCTFVLRQDGQMFGVGENVYGELGDGSQTGRTSSVPVLGSGEFVAASANLFQTIAAKSDGTVWAWGYNNNGQLGDGTTTNHFTPTQVPGLTGATAVAAGYFHSVALKNDGTVWAWGSNSYGQLGDGTTTSHYAATQISGLSGVIAVSCGFEHTLALKSDGTVWGWGCNTYGQLGDGTTTNRSTPVQVSSLTNVVAIACGYNHSIAVKSDGSIWAWGYNGSGQLGNGGTSSSSVPVQMSGVSGVTRVASMASTTLILKSDGTVWGCGDDTYGQLGNGTTGTYNTPIQMSGISGVVAIAMGYYHTSFVKSDGTVWSCGYNGYGQLGNGTYNTSYTPVQIGGLTDCVFSVVADGNPPPTYQWQREPAGQTGFTNLSNSAPFSGVTTSQLRISSPPAAMNGDKFLCIVTNPSGTVTSNVVTLVLGNPTLSILGGNNQTAQTGTFNANPFDLAVGNAAGSEPLYGATVTFSVQSGGGYLATTNTGSPTLYSSLTLTTDIDGTAQVYYKQPSGSGVSSQILASSGGGQITFTTSTISGTPPNAPDWVQAGTVASNSITISWGAASTASGGSSVVGYNVYRNGTLLNSTPIVGTQYTDTTVAANTDYTYTIKTVDTSGGLSTATTLEVSTAGTFEVFTPMP